MVNHIQSEEEKMLFYYIYESKKHKRIETKGTHVEYRISLNVDDDGLYEWKIELLYDGKVQGRVVPSYYGDDWEEIEKLMKKIEKIVSETPNDIKLLSNSRLNLSEKRPLATKEKKPSGRLKYVVSYGDQNPSLPLSMRTAVWQIVKAYVQANNPTVEKAKEFFNSEDLPNSSYDVVKELKEFESWLSEKNDSDPRYFNRQEEIITAKDGEIVVCSQWIKESFDKFKNEIIAEDSKIDFKVITD